MTLAKIASWVARATRMKLSPDQIIILMDAAQKMAFDQDMKQFLVWTEDLTIYSTIEFLSTGYTSAVAGDIGKAVVGGTSATSGVLVSYDNSTRIWVVNTTNDYTNSEHITITAGTGAGTLIATSAQLGYVGPYDAPTDPVCRKIWGVTTATDTNIFGLTDLTTFPMDDFDFLPNNFNPNAFFKPGREDNIGKTFIFAQNPGLDTTYRWVYWRDAQDIDGTTDDTQLEIPSTYHLNFANACVKLAQISLSGEDVDPKVIGAFFQPWWNTLTRPYTPMGRASNQSIGARGNPDIHI